MNPALDIVSCLKPVCMFFLFAIVYIYIYLHLRKSTWLINLKGALLHRNLFYLDQGGQQCAKSMLRLLIENEELYTLS